MSEKMTPSVSNPETEDWAVNDSIEQHLSSLALSLVIGPKEEWNETIYPLKTLKKWRQVPR